MEADITDNGASGCRSANVFNRFKTSVINSNMIKVSGLINRTESQSGRRALAGDV